MCTADDSLHELRSFDYRSKGLIPYTPDSAPERGTSHPRGSRRAVALSPPSRERARDLPFHGDLRMTPLLLPTLMRFGLLVAARTAPLASGTISRAGAIRLAMVTPMRMVTAPAMLAMTAKPVHAAAATKERCGSRTLMSAASSLEEQIVETINSNKIVVYSKSYCPFCARFVLSIAPV
eukprot:2888910-Pleurochrysis_carterae.AAC.7